MAGVIRWLVASVLVLPLVTACTSDQDIRVESPSGRLVVRAELVLEMIDPTWDIEVRETTFLGGRWAVGCVSGDDPANELYDDSLRWVDDDTVTIETDRGVATLEVARQEIVSDPEGVVGTRVEGVCRG